jgi:enoyl-CoA hydratase/carnithine racemase
MKRKELEEYIKSEIMEILTESTEEEIAKTKELTKSIEDLEDAKKKAGLIDEVDEDDNMDDEEMDKKAAKSAKKSKDSVSTISKKLADNASEMKTVVKKWKSSEEPEKSKHLSRLKELTKIKQELEKLL